MRCRRGTTILRRGGMASPRPPRTSSPSCSSSTRTRGYPPHRRTDHTPPLPPLPPPPPADARSVCARLAACTSLRPRRPASVAGAVSSVDLRRRQHDAAAGDGQVAQEVQRRPKAQERRHDGHRAPEVSGEDRLSSSSAVRDTYAQPECESSGLRGPSPSVIARCTRATAIRMSKH